MAGEKVDELVPHPVKDQLPGVDYCVTSCPNWPEVVLLGFQHYLVMLGTRVLVPAIIVPFMCGKDERFFEKAEVIQTLLFVCGINTLLQVYFGTRQPFLLHSRGDTTISLTHMRFRHTMQGIQGSLMVAFIFHVVIGYLSFWRIGVRYISPPAAVPLVTLTRLGLFRIVFPFIVLRSVFLDWLFWLLFLSMFLMWESIRAIFSHFRVLLAVAILYVEILTVSGAYDNRSPQTQTSCRSDRSGLLGATPWIRVPYPFQWGHPSVNAGDLFAYVAAIFVESMGTFIAASRFGSATPAPPSILSRGAGDWHIAMWKGSVTGSTATVTDQVRSCRVIEISAAFMLFFSVLGKFCGLLASIPLPIVAALYCLLSGHASSASLGLLQFCNFKSFRMKFILGFSLFIGLSVPRYFDQHFLTPDHFLVHTHATWFNNITHVIFASFATVALKLAYFLDSKLVRNHSASRVTVAGIGGKSSGIMIKTVEARSFTLSPII